MTRVLVVEDERLAGGMIKAYIDSASDRYEFVDCIKVAADAPLMCMSKKIDLVLMDVCTAGNSSGLDAAEKIKTKFPDIKVIIITSAPEYRFIEKARSAGADSFWYKEIEDSELLEVMDKTMAGESIYPDKTPNVKLGYAESYEFTAREKETLYWLVKIGNVKSIAEKMGISADGVNQHIKSLKEKTGLHSKAELAVLASKTKLVLPEY